jgi:hypothetical protein
MRSFCILCAIFGLCVCIGARAEAHGTYVVYHPVVDVCCSPPVAITTYYAPAPAVVYPSAVVRTRWRPLLGGPVTRVRYAPAARWWW